MLACSWLGIDVRPATEEYVVNSGVHDVAITIVDRGTKITRRSIDLGVAIDRITRVGSGHFRTAPRASPDSKKGKSNVGGIKEVKRNPWPRYVATSFVFRSTTAMDPFPPAAIKYSREALTAIKSAWPSS